MVDTPHSQSSGPVRIRVLSHGETVAETIRFRSIDVERAVGAIPRARLTLDDGDMATGGWPVADSDAFTPGAGIEIRAGYGDGEATLFQGIVVGLGTRITATNQTVLVVECRDRAVRLTLGRRDAVYVDRTDSDIIAQLAAAHGLEAQVEPTRSTHPALVQQGRSDWDFVVARAEANGQLVIVEDGAMRVRTPQAGGSADLAVTYGVDLLDFQADIDARTQLATVEAVAWDPATQELVRRTAGPVVVNAQGDLDAGTLSQAIGPSAATLRAASAASDQALEDLAKARQTRAALERIRGRLSFQGSAKARVGGVIEVAGVGQRFSGPAFVGAVAHRISDGQWVTEVGVGLPERWGSEPRHDGGALGSVTSCGIAGLQVGVVLQTGGDPQGEPRVLVQAPLLSETGVWARLAQISASDGFGAFVMPEAGDEVVLGYFDGDPSQPVVLGSLYSRRRPAPYSADAASRTKALVTRTGAKIEIDDEGPSVTIVTPGDRRIVISDEARAILLSDGNGNTVTLGPGGIGLESAGDITISAKGALNLAAVGGISAVATGDVSLTGLNVALRAQAAFVAAGAASAELAADGQTTVRGAMVLIN